MTSPRRASPTRGAKLAWISAWLPLLALGTISFVADRQASALLLWALAAILTPIVLHRITHGLWRVLVVVAVFLSSALVGEAYVARWTWRAFEGQVGSVATDRWLGVIGAQAMAAGSSGGSVERVWKLPQAPDALTVSLDLRQDDAPAGWSWYAYDPGFVIRPVSGSPGFAHITTPPDRGSYVTRRIDTGAPLAGRTFRASLRLRASEALHYAESSCRGVLLREVNGSGAASCFAQELTTEWQELVFTWRAPDAAISPIIRIELRVEAAWFMVGDVRLEEASAAGWIPLGPLEPAGVVVAVAVPGRAPIDWPRRVVAPVADQWTSWQWHLEEPVIASGGGVRVLLSLEPSTAIQVRRVQVGTGTRASLPPRTLPPRTEGWFGHPNLAGHALASIGTAAAAAAPSAIAAAVLGAVTLVGIQTTGSRTAFIAALVVLPWLVWLMRQRHAGRRPTYPWALAALLLITVLATAAGGLSGRGTAGVLDDGNSIPRTSIWVHAWAIVRERPWSGLPAATDFRDSWGAMPQDAGAATPTHAHNLWLDLGATHGVLGLAAGAVWAIALLAVSLRYLRPAATVVTIGFLILQTTDLTATNTSVYLPYVVFMAIQLGRQIRAGPADGARTMAP